MNRIETRKQAVLEILPKEGETAMSTADVASILKLHHYVAQMALTELVLDGLVGLMKFKKSRYWYKKGDTLAL